MPRFLRVFDARSSYDLVHDINEYAKRNNLTIISFTTTATRWGAVVLFEGDKHYYEYED